MKLAPAAAALALGAIVSACSAGEGPPSEGTYTLQFPSTAAAVATDQVQLLIFDAPADPAARTNLCPNLIQARKRLDKLDPVVINQPVNICELLAGLKPVTLPYGDKAVLAVGQRKDPGASDYRDFLIGCAIQTIGDGDAPLPIHLALLDVGSPVPETTCTSVSGFCSGQCQ